MPAEVKMGEWKAWVEDKAPPKIQRKSIVANCDICLQPTLFYEILWSEEVKVRFDKASMPGHKTDRISLIACSRCMADPDWQAKLERWRAFVREYLQTDNYL